MENTTHHRAVELDGVKIFYREAGQRNAITILLLHGYPSSSHMFRNLIPVLGAKYHVVAPDLPGFGFSDSPAPDVYSYTFENLTRTMELFIAELKLESIVLYLFDYGAPVGFRLALKQPDKIAGIISQNGNAYEEGLGPIWNVVRNYWQHPTDANITALKGFTAMPVIRGHYEEGVDDISVIPPENYLLDQHFLDRPGSAAIQLELLGDFRSNVEMYPEFQDYFIAHQPKLLALWGSRDPYYLAAGAEAFKKHNHRAEVKVYPTGRFVLETHLAEITSEIFSFMDELLAFDLE